MSFDNPLCKRRADRETRASSRPPSTGITEQIRAGPNRRRQPRMVEQRLSILGAGTPSGTRRFGVPALEKGANSIRFKEVARSGHAPTLVSAFLYFDVSFMVWVMLGPLGTFIGDELKLSATQKGLMTAYPVLGGAVLRL